MTMTLDQDLQNMSPFLEDFHQHHLEGLQMMEDFHALRDLPPRDFAPSLPLRRRCAVPCLCKIWCPRRPKIPGQRVFGWGSGCHGRIFHPWNPISEEFETKIFLDLSCSNGLVKKPPDPTSFLGECNIKKKKHFWWSNPLPRMPVATITSCGEKNPSHRWLQRWHFFYLPNIGERWVSVLKIAHLWVVKNQHPMIAMSQLHDFFHFSIQRFKNRAQMVQKKSQWSETSA